MDLQTEKSYFDGGLLQLIGWQLLGALVTLLPLAFADTHYFWYLRFLA